MIHVRYEFNGKTLMGFGKMEAETSIFSDYRDIETVERVIKEVKKLFGNKSVSNQCVTFSFMKKDYNEVSTSRFLRFYSEEITYVEWADGFGCGVKHNRGYSIKAKDIKEAYLACADRAIEYENEEKAKEEAI